MSNLKISYNPVGWNATTIAGSTPNSDYDRVNFSRGPRSVTCERFGAGTEFNIEYTQTGIQFTADHVIIARADLLQDSSVTGVDVQRSNNGTTWFDEHSVSGFASADLVGPDTNDFIETFTESSASFWWRMHFTATSSNFKHSKHYIGTGFDFGDDPVEISHSIERANESAEMAVGDREFLRLDKPRNKFKITWRGITNAKIYEADQGFLRYSSRLPVFLYTTTNHEILNDFQVVHCQLVGQPEVNKLANDYNEIKLEFIELLG